MAKTETPFMGMDFSKMGMDFSKMGFPDFGKAMKDFQVPGLNIDQFLTMQRKNVEALSAAGQLAADGFQSLAKRQAEIARETMEEMSGAMKDMMAAGSPEANASKQQELAKHMFERALSNVRELAELAARSNTEAFEVINKRIVESLDELRKLTPGQSK